MTDLGLYCCPVELLKRQTPKSRKTGLRGGFLCSFEFYRTAIFADILNVCIVVDLYLCECLVEVSDDVIDMLHTDGETDGGRRDVLLGEFFRRQL